MDKIYKLAEGEALDVSAVAFGKARMSGYLSSFKGKRIMLYGDSIFSTDYSWLKESLQTITGADDVYNGGISGASASQLAQASSLARALDYAPDICIVMVGGNDSGTSGTMGTFGLSHALSGEQLKDLPNISQSYGGSSFIESVAYIANYLSYHIGGFRRNAYEDGLCENVGAALSSNALDNVSKPLVILCTPLPQQRSDENNAFSLPLNNARKAEAVREVAKLCNIPLLDLSVLCGFSRLNEPFWTSPTNTSQNKGTYTMDGLHPNQYGYERIAKLILHFISQYTID